MVHALQRDYYSIEYACEYLGVELSDLIHYGEVGRITFWVKILGKVLTVDMQVFDVSDEALDRLQFGNLSNLIEDDTQKVMFTGLASLRARDIMKIDYDGSIQFAILECLDEELNCTSEFMNLHCIVGEESFEFSYSLDKVNDVNIKDVYIKTVDMKYLESLLGSPELQSQVSNSIFLNSEVDKYPPELGYAIKAWQIASSSEGKGKPKARIRKWLDENTELSNEAKERISIVANWDKAGGATKT